MAQQDSFVLQKVQPALLGLMDGAGVDTGAAVRGRRLERQAGRRFPHRVPIGANV
jgi:hypothetical protein